LELGRDLRLVEKAPPRLRVLGAALLDALQRDIALQFFIDGDMDLTQTAFGMEALDGKSPKTPRARSPIFPAWRRQRVLFACLSRRFARCHRHLVWLGHGCFCASNSFTTFW